LFAAGAGNRIVGVDDSSDYPAAVAGIARVGEPAALDVEGLLKLKPTLVVLWDSGTPASRKAELERLKLRLYVTDQHHLDDIGATLMEFGRLAGTLPVAAAAARRYQIELAQLRSRYAARPRLRVFYQVWDRPLYTLSGAHVVSEVLSLCGGDNVFAELSTLAPAVDKEAVLARNPEVILIAATGAALFFGNLYALMRRSRDAERRAAVAMTRARPGSPVRNQARPGAPRQLAQAPVGRTLVYMAIGFFVMIVGLAAITAG